MNPLAHQVIKASAGSGKTHRLCLRFIELLHRGASPDRILATTFTRKAAGEILGRVMERLAEAALDASKAAKLSAELGVAAGCAEWSAHLRVLAANLHRLSVATLDSFFHRAAASFRLELGLPPDAAIADDDDPRIADLRIRAIGELVAGDHAEAWVEMLRALHHDRAPRSAVKSIDTLASDLYETWRQAAKDAWLKLEAVGAPLSDRERERAADELEGFIASVQDKNWRKALKKHVAEIRSEDWRAMISGGLVANVLAGKAEFARKPIPPPLLGVLERVGGHARHVITLRQARSVLNAGALLLFFDRAFTRLRREERLLLRSDVPLALGRSLAERRNGEIEELYYRLDTRYDHILLDEFQDTSLAQWEILRPMAEEICAHGPAEATGRSFFCVGDEKQAIYGWRGGSPGIFERMMKDLHLDDKNPETLAESRRSSPIILAAVNRVFTTLATNPALRDFPSIAERWTKQYVDHFAHQANLPGYVVMRTVKDGGENGDEGGDEDGGSPSFAPAIRASVELVDQLREDAPHLDIGVLVWTNDAAHEILTALRAHGIAASGEGGSPLDDDPAVTAILAALDLADHPGHAPAVFEALHSPLRAALDLASLDAAHAQRCGARIRRALIERGYASVVAEWALALGPQCDERSAARLDRLIDLASSFDADRAAAKGLSAIARPADFARLARETSIVDAASARVRVMTVYKAKGLEFDIVVLPELSGLFGRVDSGFIVHRRERGGPIDAIYGGGAKEIRALNPKVAEAYRLEEERRVEDDLACLYVAMTRARQGLCIFLPALSKTKNGWSSKGWSNRSYATILRRGLSDALETETAAGDETLYERGDKAWMRAMKRPEQKESAPRPPIRYEAPARGDRPSRFLVRSSPSALARGGAISAATILRKGIELAAVRGLVIHAWFEMIEWADEPAATDAERRAHARRSVPEAPSAVIDALLPAFARLLARPETRSALARPALEPGETCEVWRERPFCVRRDDGLIDGRFDRVVVVRRDGAPGADKPVRAELIEFKAVENFEADVVAHAETYRPQIETYRAALARLLSLDAARIEASLLFVDPEKSSARRVAVEKS